METRYAFVARTLSEAIGTGRYPLGSVLPNELELAAEFGVSRSTIRAAMRELQASGLVSRKKSAGTRVEATSPQANGSGFTQALSSIEAIQQFGFETVRDVQSIEDVVADEALARTLGCKPGSRWLRISSLRRLPDRPNTLPICWTDVYIAASVAGDIRGRIEGYRGIFGDLIEETTGRRIVEIRQDIRAAGVPDSLAKPLQAPAGSHALKIRRQYVLSPGTLIEVTISVHPADRFSYSTRLRRQEPVSG
ncbi:GntR family transcriptional regulator [Inquilinus limosus]|uniref:GntR family transcriptional regulator n=1 Tax=Inquilinus limosus TaxID=171674 RepID=A0A211ZUF5_9PROT|nr:GntR family transcriptional regulator [Inquilinus limosus]OWJ68839.1 GntR family transcriptional regulator [Inquilinus limosus]